jgi:phospholipid/cholesterol/gamma-HCH transport system permease protein
MSATEPLQSEPNRPIGPDPQGSDGRSVPPSAAGRLEGAGLWSVSIGGAWSLEGSEPRPPPALPDVWAGVRGLVFDASGLGPWDSTLIVHLLGLTDAADERDIPVDTGGLPPGVRGLLGLARAVPEPAETERARPPMGLLAGLGSATLAVARRASEVLGFLGETVLALGRLALGRARLRRSDLALYVQQCGAEALGIVALISTLVGLIMAFVGSVELKYYGAQLYIADAVAIGMVREMGALMTAIVMAGRTGAAYAAQLGSMQVNEEVDALRTLGLAPVEFLVLPRVLALVMMLPLLTLYSNALGIMGGMAVGVGLFDLAPSQYLHETWAALGFVDLWVGLFLSLVFAVVVALAGCWHGLESGRSAAAVGDAATRAVVSGILGIVVTNSVVVLVTTQLGI